MIGHDYIFPYNNMRKMTRDFLPTQIHNFADFRQKHHAITNLSEKTFPVSGADGQEIKSVL